jgi:hypothetical protein
VALAAVPSKQAPDVVDALVEGWQKLGCPRYLQMDYEYNLPHIIDLTVLADLAELLARVQTATGSSLLRRRVIFA